MEQLPRGSNKRWGQENRQKFSLRERKFILTREALGWKKK